MSSALLYTIKVYNTSPGNLLNKVNLIYDYKQKNKHLLTISLILYYFACIRYSNNFISVRSKTVYCKSIKTKGVGHLNLYRNNKLLFKFFAVRKLAKCETEIPTVRHKVFQQKILYSKWNTKHLLEK